MAEWSTLRKEKGVIVMALKLPHPEGGPHVLVRLDDSPEMLLSFGEDALILESRANGGDA